ncbi:MAG TPA: dipeptidase [Limnochordia bacterium]
MSAASVEQYLRAHRSRHLEELRAFLRIPSISALSAHRADMVRAAEWLAEHMRGCGLHGIEVIRTEGHPIVYGERIDVPDGPTALIYGHYDVQPIDPPEAWTSPPFDPVIREGRIYARGASDDKGQLFLHLKAIEAFVATGGRLPVNVKVLIEGEEEVGSAHLAPFVSAERARLAADVVVISDSTLYQADLPALCVGLRGIIDFEIHLRTGQSDLHSGLFGGTVPNALHVMADLVAGLHDADGRVNVPGFYAAVRPLSPLEQQSVARLPFDPAAFCQAAGVKGLVGEAGFSPLERIWARPTLEVNGLWGGFQGEGPKTIVPAEAHAKFTCRLVADQDPEAIAASIEAELRRRCPEYAALVIRRGAAAPPWQCSPDEPALQAAARALQAAYGVEPALIRMGGSIPVVPTLARLLEAPVVLMGFGLPSDNVHAPDEHFHLADFDRGLRAIIHYWERLAESGAGD